MFDLDAGKLLVFGIVALAVIPAKDLPRVLRTVGQYVGKMRRMAADFQGQFMDAMREADIESVKKEIRSIEESSKVATSFDMTGVMRPIDPPKTIGAPVVALDGPVETPIVVAEPKVENIVSAEPIHSAHAEPSHSAPTAPSHGV